MASAFDKWLEHTQASQESRAKVQGSVMRLLHRTLYSAFAAWQEVSADKAQQRAKVLTCLARISNRVRLVTALCLSCAARQKPQAKLPACPMCLSQSPIAKIWLLSTKGFDVFRLLVAADCLKFVSVDVHVNNL